MAFDPPRASRPASRAAPSPSDASRPPMAAFRFLTAGESHGQTLGVTIEGVPAGLPLTAEALAGRPRPPATRLRPRSAPADRARPRRDRRRRAPWRDARFADPPPRRQPRLGELDAGDAGRAARRGGSRRARRAGGRRQQARRTGHPRPARPRRSRRRPEVRLQRRPQRARTRLRTRDRGAGRGRRRRAGVPPRARNRGLVLHRRGRRRRGRSRQHDALPRRGRRVTAALPRSGGRGGG